MIFLFNFVNYIKCYFRRTMQTHNNKLLRYRMAACAFFIMQGTIFSTWANRIADIRTALNLTEADLGLILLGLPFGQLITMPISGYLVSKFSSKRCIYFGSVMYPSCLLLIAAATGFWSLLAALVCFGVSANINNIAINTQAVGVEKLYGRSIMGTFHGTWSLSCFVGGLFAMLLMHLGVGTLTHFYITIATSLIILITVSPFLMPKDPDKVQSEEDKSKTRGFFSPTPFILMLGATAFGSMSCEGTMFDWSVIYFRDIVKVPIEFSNIGYIAFMSMMATGRFMADFFINRFGAIRVLQFSGITITCGMLLAVIFPYVSTSIIGFLLVGIGVSSVIPICYSSAAKSKRIPMGIAIATVSSIGFLGFLLGPPVIGFIAHASSLRVSFATMAFVGLLVTIIAPFLRFRLGK